MEFKPRKKLYAQESAGNRPNKVIRIYTPVYNRLAALAELYRWTLTDVASELLEKALDEYSAGTSKKLYTQESASDHPIRIYTPVYNRLASLAESHGWTLTDVASRLLEKALDEYSAVKRSDH